LVSYTTLVRSLLSRLILKSDFFKPGTATSTKYASADSLIFTFGKVIPSLKFDENTEGKSLLNKSSINEDQVGVAAFKLLFSLFLFFKTKLLIAYKILS